MTRSSPRYYAVNEIASPPQPSGRGRPAKSFVSDMPQPVAATRYVLLGGPYPSRARAGAEHPDAGRIITAYEYDAARYRGLITLPDGTIPPEAANPQVPQWRYALEIGDASATYLDEREDRVFRFSSQDGRASWLRNGVPVPGLPGSRIPLLPNDPRVVAMRERVAAGKDEWPKLTMTLYARRTANQARAKRRPRQHTKRSE